MKNLYKEDSEEPFKLSRSKIDLFVECPRCFYLDRKLGIERPKTPGFTLNIAVDALLKKEFDIHRAENKVHPLMKAYNIEAVPFSHEKIGEWRHNFTGVRVFYEPANFLVYGAVDDIWLNKNKELHIVDYKATSTSEEITLEDEWKQSYKRQMEIYQWLSRHNEDLMRYKISDTGYFVYCNGKKDRKAFDGKLEFDVEIIAYQGNDNWVEKTILDIHECLNNDKIPESNPKCKYCGYVTEFNKSFQHS